MGEIIKLANSLQKANLKDEKTIRKLIAKISRMVNMPVSKEKEEFIVKAIMNDRLPNSLSGLLKMFNPPEK
ncbi:stage VI sporulation protein F [Caldalkalibacillus thermarum TA2.A1]|nr:stage VI sporulation protein F [Caldalkalibacillus thermarum TA2.A1]